ncbi:MFS transporter [Nocardia sp. NPDC051030]|uniref:MFS transporter n=1 Tax=Nocardia sp. NPDC051030 TaxID=3155162 RepID=UPI0034469D43
MTRPRIDGQSISNTLVESDPGSNRLRRMALPIICLAQFMVVLDVAIVNIAIPSIQRGLGFSDSRLAWVVDAYTLVFGALLLAGGRAADLFGRRRMFVLGITVFTVGSLVGGMATTPVVLLTGRVLQGLGAAAVAPAALSLVTVLYAAGPARQRAMTLYAAMAGLGAIGGELLGGVFTEFLSWRWVFFVNVPVGIALLAVAPLALPAARGARSRGLDLPGAVIGTAALSCLVYGAIRAGAHGWTEPLTMVLLAMSAILALIFRAVEKYSAAPMLPLGLLNDRVRCAAIVTMAATYGCLYPILFFGTRLMQDVHEFSALQTGLAFLPCGFAMLVAAGIAKQLVVRTGPQPLMVAGAIGYLGVALWLAAHVRDSYPTLLPGLILLGLAVSCVTVGVTLSAIDGVPAADSGVMSGVLGAAQQVGGTVGVAALATIASRATQHRLTGTAPSPGVVSDALSHGFSIGFLTCAGLAVVAIVAAGSAYRRR